MILSGKEAAKLMRELPLDERNRLILAAGSKVTDIRHLYGVRKAPEDA